MTKPPRAAASDLLRLDEEFSAAELETRAAVREFVDRRIRPNIARWYEDAHFPREIVPEMGELGLLGMHLKGYGCAGRSAVEYGVAMQELEAGDSGLRTFVSVQGSLAMSAISTWGSEQQKGQWLPRMATGDAIGCFGLTEPTAGSDPSSMQTFARQEGGDWVLDGTKRWIGLASIADIAIIWAMTEEGVRGFLVPASTPGFTAIPIEPKLSMRASIQCDVALDGVRLPADAGSPTRKDYEDRSPASTRPDTGSSGALSAPPGTASTPLSPTPSSAFNSASRWRAISSRRTSLSAWRSRSKRGSCSRCASVDSRTRTSWKAT